MPYGRSNIILPFLTNQLIKERARHGTPCHDTITQKRIHGLAQRIIYEGNYDHLRVPALSEEATPHTYAMEMIDTSHPIWLGNEESLEEESVNLIMDLKSDLERFWRAMWAEGFAPWDFQLYLQGDGAVMMIGFDKFGFRHDQGNGAPVELPVPVHLDEFFAGDCFPRDFRAGVDWQHPRSRRHPRVN